MLPSKSKQQFSKRLTITDWRTSKVQGFKAFRIRNAELFNFGLKYTIKGTLVHNVLKWMKFEETLLMSLGPDVCFTHLYDSDYSNFIIENIRKILSKILRTISASTLPTMLIFSSELSRRFNRKNGIFPHCQ
jgi:hypothetical protein